MNLSVPYVRIRTGRRETGAQMISLHLRPFERQCRGTTRIGKAREQTRPLCFIGCVTPPVHFTRLQQNARWSPDGQAKTAVD